MIRIVKALLCASLFLTLTFPFSSNALAQNGGGSGKGGGTNSGGGTGGGGNGGGGNGGGGNGGGGKPTAPPSAPLTFTGGLITVPATDQAAFVQLRANSDGLDAPVITEVSGPAGLIPNRFLPADHPRGSNGFTVADYTWTPSPADAGTSPVAVFTARTQSGATQTIQVILGPVQSVAPGAISGLTAQIVGGQGRQINAIWNPSANGTSVVYNVSACYSSLLAGTDLPFVYCDSLVSLSSTVGLMNIPLGPSNNIGQPGVAASYYGILVQAIDPVTLQLEGQVTANVQGAR